MKKLSLLVATVFSATVCSLTGLAPLALAATAPATPKVAPGAPGSGQALEIAPPLLSLSGDPGQVLKAQINLRDISSTSLIVSGQVNDFVAAGEDGTPKILMNNDTSSPFSMKSWVGALPTLNMTPRQIKNFPITITIPKNASPGGHYGVIRFTATPPDLKGTGVSLSASLGALVLLTVNGNAKESMNIQEFSVNRNGKTAKLFESTPLTFVERLKNTGNIHEKPAGQVIIKNMFGKNVAALNVNMPPRNILPDSIRKFSQPLDKSVIGSKKLFGKYTADLKVTYGANKQVTTSSLSFWVIPYRLIITVIVLLVVCFFALRFLIKHYNRRIISKAQKQNTQTKPSKKKK
jgi:hypothetical protein